MKNYVAPGGMHVRVDSGLYTGYRVPPYYDSMIGKLIVYGSNRDSCIRRLKRALEEFVVEGMKTTIPLHQKLVRDPEFLAGNYTIKWLEQWLARNAEPGTDGSAIAPAVMLAVAVLAPSIVVPIAAARIECGRRPTLGCRGIGAQRPCGMRWMPAPQPCRRAGRRAAIATTDASPSAIEIFMVVLLA